LFAPRRIEQEVGCGGLGTTDDLTEMRHDAGVICADCSTVILDPRVKRSTAGSGAIANCRSLTAAPRSQQGAACAKARS
jgi:hypothetical protein